MLLVFSMHMFNLLTTTFFLGDKHNLRFCGSRLVQEERWYAKFAAAQIGVGNTKTVYNNYHILK